MAQNDKKPVKAEHTVRFIPVFNLFNSVTAFQKVGHLMGFVCCDQSKFSMFWQ